MPKTMPDTRTPQTLAIQIGQWCGQCSNVCIVSIAGGIFLLIAVIEWWTTPRFPLGFLYIVPILILGPLASRWIVLLLAPFFAWADWNLSGAAPNWLYLGSDALALAGFGLYVRELECRRRVTKLSEIRSEILLDNCPTAIVSLDEHGLIEIANRAAYELLVPQEDSLPGTPIAVFLPELHHPRNWDSAQFRASMRCHGRRGDGDSFTANLFLSSYSEAHTPKLAIAIQQVFLGDSAGHDGNIHPILRPQLLPHADHAEFTPREGEVLDLLVAGLANKEIAVRMSMSESVIKNTIQNLFAKAGVRSRSQLVRIALTRGENGLIRGRRDGSSQVINNDKGGQHDAM